jgi:hypothetical protein
MTDIRMGVNSRSRAIAATWVATCGCCGAETALDRRRIAALLDAGVCLRRLETQLRCSCGARQGRIEPRSTEAGSRNVGARGGALVYPFGP